jgi:hypothetical protein
MKDKSQIDLFNQIWADRPHVSFVSGKPISFFSVAHFAHVLPKGKWPKFKYEAKNIVLLTFEEHHLYDMGTENQRVRYKKDNPGTDWQKLFDLKDKLRSQYNNQI